MGRRWPYASADKYYALKLFDGASLKASSSYGSDEFNCISGSLIDRGWSLWDPGGVVLSGTIVNGTAVLEVGYGGASVVCGGFYKQIPDSMTGSFSVAAKIVGNLGSVSYTNINGIFIGENLDISASTGAIHSAEVFGDLAQYRTAGRDNYLDSIANYTATADTDSKLCTTQEYYLRLRVSGSTIYTDYSENGKFWTSFDSRISSVLSEIKSVGMFSTFGTNLSPFNLRMYYEWFRIFPGHDFNLNVGE